MVWRRRELVDISKAVVEILCVAKPVLLELLKFLLPSNVALKAAFALHVGRVNRIQMLQWVRHLSPSWHNELVTLSQAERTS